MSLVAPLPMDGEELIAPAPDTVVPDTPAAQQRTSSKNDAIAQLEASIIVGTEEEEENVDQIERVLGQFMFKEQGMSVEQAFKYHNQNEDEGLDERELKSILNKAKVSFTPREFEILMSRYDLDGSGGITTTEFQLTYRVDRKQLLDFVSLKDSQRAACVQIPITILFFLILLFLISMHDLTHEKFSTESGLSSELLATKANGVKFSTISNIKDYWTWIEGALISKAFIQTNPSTNVPLPKGDWGFMSRYNKIIGSGIEIAQMRSIKEPCGNPELSEAYGHECKPELKPSKESFGLPKCNATAPKGTKTKGCWSEPPNSKLTDSDRRGFEQSAIDCKTEPFCPPRDINDANFVFSLDYLNPQAVLKEQLKYYRDRHWIDEQTVEIIITINTYNAEHGLFAQMILSTQFDRGGRVENKWHSESIKGDPYQDYLWVIGLDIVWVIMALSLLFGEFKEMKEEGIAYFKDFWNLLDWIQCLLTIGIECYWVYIVFEGNDLLGSYAASHNPEMLKIDFNGTLATSERNEVGDQLGILLQHGIIYRYLTVLNVLVLVIRFFKAFNVQPRLAVISKTLSKSAPDLAHFIVIFMCLFWTFVMFAHFVFGHIVPTYSTVALSFYNTFRGFVAAPAVNVPEIVKTNGFTIVPRKFVFPMAELWWLMFMVLLFLVVRSILLAIVLEAYKEAKASSTHSTTMWAQANDMIRDMISGWRGIMRLGDVQNVLEKDLDPEQDRVNMQMIVACYKANKQREGAKLKEQESVLFSLVLVKEFFSFVEVNLPAQDQLRALSAYARITELDTNFNDVCTRIDKLEQKFGDIHDLLRDIKSRN